MTDVVENKIYSDTYDLFDKCLYGGLGHGVMVFPTHIFKIIFTIIFPPLGALIDTIEKDINNSYPFITWDVIIKIFKDLNKIIYSYILTGLFYIPGLIYTLSHHSIGSSDTKSSRGIVGSIICDPKTNECYDFVIDPATGAYNWVKGAGLTIGYGTRDVGLKIGYGARDVGLKTGYGARDVGLKTGYGTRDVGLKIGTGFESLSKGETWGF